MGRFLSILFLGLLSVSVYAAEQPAKLLRFSASVGMPFTNPQNTGFEDRLVKEIFNRLGYQVNIQFVPAERALRNLENGLDDGALGRVAGILTKYPQIKQIKEVAFVRDFVVFTKNVKFTPKNWATLSPYNVGIVTGWKILEKNVKGTKSLVKASEGEQLFRLLDKDRVDLIIYNRWGGLYLIKKMDLKGITLLEPPLVSLPHYFNLSVRHSDLIEPARKILVNMIADGTYQKIYNETLKPLIK